MVRINLCVFLNQVGNQFSPLLWWILFLIHPPSPPLWFFYRTIRGWRGRWRRSSERGRRWRGSSGGFWRAWTTQPGTRQTSEINVHQNITDRIVTFKWPNGLSEMLFNLCGNKLPLCYWTCLHRFHFNPHDSLHTTLWTKRRCLQAISKAITSDFKVVKPK